MKICFVAHNAYGAMTGETSGHIGGVERQISLLSKWLVARGHSVSVVTWNEGESLEADGVRLIPTCAPDAGLPVLRFFSPRWTSLIAALREADADVYYHNCAEYITGQIALWCQWNQRRFVYSVASDMDCEKELPDLKTWREKYLFETGIRRADLLIVQSYQQKEMMEQNFGLHSNVIRMPAQQFQMESELDPSDGYREKKIIWVGRIHRIKRVEWFAEIAARLPEYEFVIAGPIDDEPEIETRLQNSVESTQNLSYIGRVSRSEMQSLYLGASLLCCTSEFEGFPNTFLEAWGYQRPVVSTFDPDGLIESLGLGKHATSIDELVAAVESLMSDQVAYSAAARNGSAYVLESHDFEKIQAQFESQFLSLAPLDE